MPLNQPEAGKLRKQFELLADEVGTANTHFHIGKHLADAWRVPFQKDLYKSNIFWGYTTRAHWQLVLLFLCRVYDDFKGHRNRPEKEPFHLLRLVQELDEPKLSDSDKKQRTMHLAFLQKEDRIHGKFPDPTVAKLRKLRHNLVAHTNAYLLEGGLHYFVKDKKDNPVTHRDIQRLKKHNALTRREIQRLIKNAFSIMERWQDYYIERPSNYKGRTRIQRLAKDSDDYVFVLESLKQRVRQDTPTPPENRSLKIMGQSSSSNPIDQI